MKLVRTAVAALVLVAVTAAPAVAQPPGGSVQHVSSGLCRLWPRLCT